MHHPRKSFAAGMVSGLLVYLASIYLLAHTNALAMPADFPLLLWEAFVVFGLGAVLVAAVVHFLALHLARAAVIPALVGFAISVLGGLVISGLLATSGKVVAAWLVGTLLASVLHARLMSDRSSKPSPLRGST